jgi:hypothetical protein
MRDCDKFDLSYWARALSRMITDDVLNVLSHFIVPCMSNSCAGSVINKPLGFTFAIKVDRDALLRS